MGLLKARIAPREPVDPPLDLALVRARLPAVSPEDRRAASEAQREEASWLAELLIARAQHALPELPAFPALAVQILKILDAAEPSFAALVAAIHDDPGVSAQVLRTANSAYYARGVEIATLHDAAVRMGLRGVGNIAVAAATRAVLDDEEYELRSVFRDAWARQWRYAMASAHGARWLASWLSRGVPEHAFLAGLLHDVGKLVALRVAGDMVHAGELPPNLAPELLDALLEAAHGELGEQLTLQWRLPGYVQDACARHHVAQLEPVPANELLHLVRLASTLFELRASPFRRASVEEELLVSAMALELEAEPLCAIASELARLERESAPVFSVR